MDNLFCQIFSTSLFLYPKHRAFPPLFPTGFLSLFMLPFFLSSTPLFTLCLCLFSTTSAEASPSKDEKQTGSKNIPLLVHGFVHGSVPFLGEQSNWHHSLPCGTGQRCYVAQATIPNWLLGCWEKKMYFLLLVCLKVTVAWWHCTQVAATASEALKEPHQAALRAQTHQSHRKPHPFCSLRRVKQCVQQLSYKTTTTTMPETMLF